MKKRKIGRLLFWLLLLVVVISATGGDGSYESGRGKNGYATGNRE